MGAREGSRAEGYHRKSRGAPQGDLRERRDSLRRRANMANRGKARSRGMAGSTRRDTGKRHMAPPTMAPVRIPRRRRRSCGCRSSDVGKTPCWGRRPD
jgi:hypothetical protein